MNPPFPRLFAPLALALGLAACASTAPAPPASPTPLLLISVDGLRPRDITPEQMPNLHRLAGEGVIADGMRPAYPSLTFPNHYTLVTGLRPDKHGIVHNSMHDAELGEFRLSRREAVSDGRWWGGLPVWVSVEKAGLRSATLYWPGSEAVIAGIRPGTWLHFDASTSAHWRARQVADWLRQPRGRRPDFATLYFDKVDHASHQHGPNSAEAAAERRDTDAAIGTLLQSLRRQGLMDSINIVVVSDHGFAEVPAEQTLAIEDMVAVEDVQIDAVGQTLMLTPKPGQHQARAEARLLGRHAHYQCWRRAELPAQWHYGSHARVGAIVCQMDEGWDALPRAMQAQRQAGQMRGSHGYDPDLPSMQASFIARGPAFRRGSRLPLFDNVDVYPLLMKLLHLPAASHDGNVETFNAVLTGQ